MATMTASRKAEIATYRAADERIAAAWDEVHAAKAPYAKIQTEIREAKKRMRSTSYADSRSRYADRIEKLEAAAELLLPDIEAKREAAIELDRELYTGWPRFFHVEHLHSNMHCSSFRPTTRVGWVPQASGLTEAEAVAVHGASLCTKCFPSAPVELTRDRPEPGLCAGSGKAVDRNNPTGNESRYYSPNGTCQECGKTVSLTSRGSGRIRKHKAEAAA